MKKVFLIILVVFLTVNVVLAEDMVSVPILMFHDFTDNINDIDSRTITIEKLESVLDKFEENGYKTITFAELQDYVDGKIKLEDKVFLITMDDGYRSNYTKAYPILKERKMNALISIIGWSVGQKTMYGGIKPINPHFSWDELQEMVKSGLVEVGNHSFDMHNYDEDNSSERKGTIIKKRENVLLYRKKVTEDINKLRTLIYKKCKIREEVFCYPYGLYDELTEDILDNLGYKITLTTDEGINYLKEGSSLKKLKRVNITMDTDIEEILKK